MKLTTLITATALALSTAPALASDDDHEERVEHYHAQMPETMEAATESYQTALEAIEVTLEKTTLTAADLEAIHEQSYVLESAMKKFQQHLQAQADTIEALHLASEAHKEAETRAAFDKLQPKTGLAQ